MAADLSKIVTDAWYRKALWLWLLWPLSFVFSMLSGLRKALFSVGLQPIYQAPVPVVVIGNINVGGSGKSPLVCALAKAMSEVGYRPGIVSRGYGATRPIVQPVLLNEESTANEVGDEPLMMFRRIGCPVCVCPERARAVDQLVKAGCDIIISDDGLQHYAMARDIEVCVLDGERLWGNGLLLPAGPLREPKARLTRVDYIVLNGETDPDIRTRLDRFPGKTIEMTLKPGALVPLDNRSKAVWDGQGSTVNAVAGIGHPARFFDTLESVGIRQQKKSAFPDHHVFVPQDFSGLEDLPIVMTEKDAVKCQDLDLNDAWYLPVEAQLSDNLAQDIVTKLIASGRLSAVETA